MSDEHTTPRAEDRVNTYAIIVVGLVGALLTYVSVLALQAYYASSAGSAEAQKNVVGLGEEYQSLRAEQAAAMSDYGRLGDKYTLPIDRAMELVVEDARAGGASLVPAVGPHDTATVDPETGKTITAAPAEEETAEGETAEGEGAVEGEAAPPQTGDGNGAQGDDTGGDAAGQNDADTEEQAQPESADRAGGGQAPADDGAPAPSTEPGANEDDE